MSAYDESFLSTLTQAGFTEAQAEALFVIFQVQRPRAKKKAEPKACGPIPELVAPSGIPLALEKVTQELQRAWITTYKDSAWVFGELLQAQNWCIANPQRAPKANIGRFLNSWLTRSWEKYRKTLPVTSPLRGVPVVGPSAAEEYAAALKLQYGAD